MEYPERNELSHKLSMQLKEQKKRELLHKIEFKNDLPQMQRNSKKYL